jgi:hypothetical protein
MLLLSLLLASFAHPIHLDAAQDDCSRTSGMRIYSSAFVEKETHDLLGYELAIGAASDSGTEVMLFIHEGSAGEGIPLKGQISGHTLVVDGSWVEHLVEYPSRKEIVQTYPVNIRGTFDDAWFRGTLAIEGYIPPEKIRLKRARSIWICR